MILIEVLTASSCNSCQSAKSLVRDVVAEFKDTRLCYKEVNVVEDIDYAVALGVLRTPAIALNGKLVFSVLPSKNALRHAIENVNNETNR